MAVLGPSTADCEGRLVRRILHDALQEVPLPAPWKARTSKGGQTFFCNQTTDETTWEHPLSPQLKELNPIIFSLLMLAPQARAEAGTALSKRWQWEAEVEYKKWYAAEDSASGMEYYCNRDTDETMWEHPSEAILPAFFLKIRCAERLTNHDYLQGLGINAANPSWQQQQQLKVAVQSSRRNLLYCFSLLLFAMMWLLRKLVYPCRCLCLFCGSSSKQTSDSRGQHAPLRQSEEVEERLFERAPAPTPGSAARTQMHYIGDDDDDNDSDHVDGVHEFDGVGSLCRSSHMQHASTAAVTHAGRSHRLKQDNLEASMRLAERAVLDNCFLRETRASKVQGREEPSAGDSGGSGQPRSCMSTAAGLCD
eukprot:TRINITY_DN6414_c0_g2_i2.p1 TRINITY_DN6414_c0_g2~~TRINITY_DN6414_c0_g2_i2.p1  ORF type:complete len:365 (+),score=53.42 TRINITY_DN6414_c0_g2_i2:103-1197(+)